jgi:hypothetical protein
MSQSIGMPLMARILGWVSWASLAGAVLAALTALFCLWAVNAESLGARDMGLGLFLAWASAAALVGSLYAAPFLAAVGLLSLLIQRRTGLRFLLAAAVTALPLALLTWLE